MDQRWRPHHQSLEVINLNVLRAKGTEFCCASIWEDMHFSLKFNRDIFYIFFNENSYIIFRKNKHAYISLIQNIWI